MSLSIAQAICFLVIAGAVGVVCGVLIGMDMGK